jgi:hypothetical protein
MPRNSDPLDSNKQFHYVLIVVSKYSSYEKEPGLSKMIAVTSMNSGATSEVHTGYRWASNKDNNCTVSAHINSV